MNWLESIVYGFVSGISEFLPISSSAHQALMQYLFGVSTHDPVRDLFVHIALFISVVLCTRNLLEQIKRERTVRYRNRNVKHPNRVFYDWRLVRAAILPQIFTMLALRFIFKISNHFLITTIALAINGLIIFIPERLVQANKDACSMSAIDSFLIGAAGGLTAFSGISRIGCTYSVAVIRGAAKRHAITWSLILSVYSLAFLCFLDLISIISIGAPLFWRNLYTYIFSGIAAYLGGCVSISAIRFLITRPNNNGFSYYCWGCSLFMFILYLTVV